MPAISLLCVYPLTLCARAYSKRVQSALAPLSSLEILYLQGAASVVAALFSMLIAFWAVLAFGC